MEYLITPAQNKKLHVLLSHQPGLMEMKREFLMNRTNGRTDSARRLTRREAAEIIDFLSNDDPCRKMIRKVYAICYSLNWIPFHNGNESEKRMNEAVIDRFLKKRGVKRKALRDYTCLELPALVSQFESIEKHNKQSEERKAFNLEIAEILEDLGIETINKKAV